MPDKSCKGCPQYCPPDRVATEIRANVGGGYCRMHGYVLGKPGLSESAVDTLCEKFAETCPDFGSSVVTPLSTPSAKVTTPNPDLLALKASPDFTEENLGSCISCKHLVEADAVREELGWPVPLCGMTGRLIFPNILTSAPRSCGAGQRGNNLPTTEGMYLDPRYDDAFNFDGVNISVGGTILGDEGDVMPDPREFTTDKELQGWEESEGIRGWRKIASPLDPAKFTYLPVFYPEWFPEEEQHLIPTFGDSSHPELYVDHQGLIYKLAVTIMELDQTPSLVGDAGTGKTEAFNFGAFLTQMPSRVLSMRPDTDTDELAGKWLFREGETSYQMGRLAIGYTRPNWLLVDEPNTAPDEVWELFRPMSDTRRYIPLDQAEGQILKKHDFCFFGFAMNPGWDPRYVGTRELSEADRDRLTHIIVNLPPDHLERRILSRRLQGLYEWTPSDDMMNKVMAVAETLRRMGAEGGLAVAWGLRAQFKMLECSKWFPIEESYRMAMLNDLEPQTVEQVISVVRDHF